MKKIICILLILCSTYILLSCSENEQTEDVESITPTDVIEEVYYKNPFKPLEYDLAYIKLNKEIYNFDDEIVIDIFEADSSDYVAIYDIDKEPGNGLPYKKTKVSGKSDVSYSISDLELTPGYYAVYLYQNKTMTVFDRVLFKVSDNDSNDYKITSATFNSSKENKVRKSSLTIYPSSLKELTYSVYWAKDGQRLVDYSYLVQTIKGNLDSFEINFNENMFMPDEANEIEIAVMEGESTSYFLKIDDTLKLEQSVYRYNFQVLTDIHVNDDMVRYGFWNSHLYNALLDIKCLSGNTSGIFTVGDNTDMGSSTHYDLLFKTVKSVFGEEIPNIYYTMGNHDYMYFSTEIGGMDAAVEYFIERTNMKDKYYSFDFNGNKVISLSSDIKTTPGGINEEQFNWFKNELKNTDKNKFVYIYLHQPLYNTVAGTLPGENNHGIDNVGEEITELLKSYPNAILFSGHTHYSMYGKNTAVFGNGLNANYINNGAVAYLWSSIDKVGEVGGQCNFIEVYDDYLIIKARDILTKKWISQAQFVIYLY